MATADVQKYISNPEGFTEYFIIISYLGTSWSIKKRFSDFVNLHTYLKDIKKCINLNELPARNWWQRFDPYVLDQRRKDLQVYIYININHVV